MRDTLWKDDHVLHASKECESKRGKIRAVNKTWSLSDVGTPGYCHCLLPREQDLPWEDLSLRGLGIALEELRSIEEALPESRALQGLARMILDQKKDESPEHQDLRRQGEDILRKLGLRWREQLLEDYYWHGGAESRSHRHLYASVQSLHQSGLTRVSPGATERNHLLLVNLDRWLSSMQEGSDPALAMFHETAYHHPEEHREDALSRAEIAHRVLLEGARRDLIEFGAGADAYGVIHNWRGHLGGDSGLGRLILLCLLTGEFFRIDNDFLGVKTSTDLLEKLYEHSRRGYNTGGRKSLQVVIHASDEESIPNWQETLLVSHRAWEAQHDGDTRGDSTYRGREFFFASQAWEAARLALADHT